VQQEKEAYGNLRYLYDQLVDGGSTDAVVQEIISTWPQEMWELRASLLDRSPFLSVDALKALVDRPNVPDAIKAEVCLANPEATQQRGFLPWAANDALSPLPGYIVDNIAASWDVRTYRAELEEELAERHTAMTQAVNALVAHHAMHSAAPDSIRWAWQQLRTKAARYAEASLMMEVGDFTEALNVVQSMAQEHRLSTREEAERGRMADYIGVLQSAANDERDAYHLNAGEVQQLLTMVGDHYDRPSVWASNLLCVAYGHCRAPYTGGGGDEEPKRLLPPKEEPAPAAAPALRIHPNPANNWVAMSYLLPGNTGAVSLVVRDAGGRVLHQLNAVGEQGQRVWDTRELAPGIYTVELRREGRVEHTERLVIQP
jgi:hypothetical protein